MILCREQQFSHDALIIGVCLQYGVKCPERLIFGRAGGWRNVVILFGVECVGVGLILVWLCTNSLGKDIYINGSGMEVVLAELPI